MKQIFFIITLFLLGYLNISAQDALFEKLSQDKEMSSIFISKVMLNMASNLTLDMGEMNGINDLIGKLEQVEIYSAEKSASVQLIKTEMRGFAKTYKYDILMQIKDEEDNTIFYSKQEGKIFKDLIMYVEEQNECTVIRLKGTFSTEDIQKVLKKNQ